MNCPKPIVPSIREKGYLLRGQPFSLFALWTRGVPSIAMLLESTVPFVGCVLIVLTSQIVLMPAVI